MEDSTRRRSSDPVIEQMQDTLRAIGGAVGQVTVLAAEQSHLRDLLERAERENQLAHSEAISKLHDLEATQKLTSASIQLIQLTLAKQEGEREAKALILARQAWTRPALASLSTAVLVTVLGKLLGG